MGVLAVVGSKGAPGATTTVLALALRWPAAVLVVDADPAGGDLVPGWLAGRAGLDRGLLGFAAATRHLDAAAVRGLSAALAGQLVRVPEAPGVVVLPGLGHAGQAAALDAGGWGKLATAVRTVPGPDVGWVDALVDAGGLSASTPWPLLAAAEVVLLAVRPSVRGCHHACHAIGVLEAALGGLDRVGLVVCGPGPYPPQEVGLALGPPVRAELPGDPAAAAALLDGRPAARWWLSRTLLLRGALTAARALHPALTPPAAASAALPAVWR